MIWHKDRFEVGTFDEVPSMSANQIKTYLGVEICWGIFFKMRLILFELLLDSCSSSAQPGDALISFLLFKTLFPK
jgi:hypothetical protein